MFNMQHLRLAIDLAEESVRSGGRPFGAVVVSKGRVVSRGVSHSPDGTLNFPDHAEIEAIRHAYTALEVDRLPPDTVIYSSAEPCIMCSGAILWAECPAIAFAATRETASEYGFADKVAPIVPRLLLRPSLRGYANMMDEESRRPFEIWKQLRI